MLLSHLGSAADQMDDRMKKALTGLAENLRQLARLSDETITELFERHPKPFSRVMTMFFLRETCSELLEFRHPLLSETNYVTAGVLFGARDGWLRLPLELRDHPGLQDAVSHRMAAMAHRSTNSGMFLGPPPERPIPLRELFIPGPGGWNKALEKAALTLARDSKWSCIQTRVDLGKGNYGLVVDGKGLHIVIAGEAKAVTTEVEWDKFFENFAHDRKIGKHEQKIRRLLKA